MYRRKTTLSMDTLYRRARSSCLISGVLFCCIGTHSLDILTIRHMCHDPNVYHDPFEFKPERFLGTEGRAPEPDPSDLAFGFGRRYGATFSYRAQKISSPCHYHV